VKVSGLGGGIEIWLGLLRHDANAFE